MVDMIDKVKNGIEDGNREGHYSQESAKHQTFQFVSGDAFLAPEEQTFEVYLQSHAESGFRG